MIKYLYLCLFLALVLLYLFNSNYIEGYRNSGNGLFLLNNIFQNKLPHSNHSADIFLRNYPGNYPGYYSN